MRTGVVGLDQAFHPGQISGGGRGSDGVGQFSVKAARRIRSAARSALPGDKLS